LRGQRRPCADAHSVITRTGFPFNPTSDCAPGTTNARKTKLPAARRQIRQSLGMHRDPAIVKKKSAARSVTKSRIFPDL
jgi:hypothetical protein